MITLSAIVNFPENPTISPIEINRINIQQISVHSYDRDNLKSFSFGVISNVGNIEFLDLDKKILNDYIKMGYLVEDLEVTIYLSNTLTKRKVQIAQMKTNEWNYDNNNRKVSTSLKDDLEEWQSIESFPMRLTDSMNAYSMYEYIKSQTPEKWIFEELDDITKNILTNITIKYPYLEQSNLWSQWNKLCELCGLHIYKNANAKVVIRSEFGV